MTEHGVRGKVEHGVRTAVRNNVSAYGFSVVATAAFGVLGATLGSPPVGDVFLYAAGIIAGVTLVEAIVSRGFRLRMRGEPADVIALGSSFSFASVGLAVGVAALTGTILDSWLAWLLGSLLASSVYVIASGVEMALARTAQERREETEESE